MKNSNKIKPDVLLIYPKTGMDLGSTVAPPHALLTIAAPVLKAGYAVKILDQRVEIIDQKILEESLSPETLCVGISVMTGTQIKNALPLARRIREIAGPGVPLVWGGCHPSVMPEETARHPLVDIVVVGEGDETFCDLVQTLEARNSLSDVKGIVFKENGKTIKTTPRPLLDVENLLPTPWELIEVEKYIHRDMYLKGCRRVLDIGQTSRGCPFQCGFCSSASIRNRKWRAMSVGKSLDMIIETVRRFRLDGIWLRDDEFYIDRQRATAILEGIIQANLNIKFYTSGTRVDIFLKASPEETEILKGAGAHTLKFGAEAGTQRILNLMKKGIEVGQILEVNQKCKQYGIIPAFGFIIGYPTEIFEEINQTIDLGIRLKEENPQAQLESMAGFTPLPGTPDFELSVKYGLKPPQTLEGWAEWHFDDDPLGRRNPWLTAKERRYLRNIGYMSILAYALDNAVGSLRRESWRYWGHKMAKAISYYYRFKLKHKMYKFAPDIALAAYLRKRLFYNNIFTIT